MNLQIFKSLPSIFAIIPDTLAPSRSKYALTWGFILSLLSVFFCWFFGLPGLALGIWGLRKVLPYRSKMSGKGSTAFKAKYGLRLAIAGIIMSAFFTIYYIIALAKGAYIRL